jgi:hypothetical protein
MQACCRTERNMFEGGMWIIYLEMLAVLAIGALIVWWTLPRGKKPGKDQNGAGPATGKDEP